MAHLRVLSGLLLAGLLALVAVAPARALDEADRVLLVGEKAYEDGLYPLSRRMLERFVEKFPNDARAGDATLVLAKVRLAQGAPDAALESLKKALAMTPVPGKSQEARFWEAEILYKMKRFNDARASYVRVTSVEPPSPFLPDALYGLGWADLELKRRDAAVSDFRRLVKEFPDHATAPSATIQLGRALIETKHPDEAVTILEGFPTKYPDHKLVPESRYYLARAKIAAGNTEEGMSELRAFARTYPNHELTSSARRARQPAQVREEEGHRRGVQRAHGPEAPYRRIALRCGRHGGRARPSERRGRGVGSSPQGIPGFPARGPRLAGAGAGRLRQGELQGLRDAGAGGGQELRRHGAGGRPAPGRRERDEAPPSRTRPDRVPGCG